MSYDSKPKNGFILGKFMPPHTGHQFLCEFGASYCENLTILVCSLANEPIPGELRFEWMKRLFPQCNVVWCSEELPQEPKDENDLEFWAIWKQVVEKYGPERVDVVFASEAYGKRLAKEVNAEFIPCDMGRVFHPCSGTEVRHNPRNMWKYIPPVVRPYYTKRVCLFGPESSGKTTLARVLAEHYQTVFVPEYGRTYTEFFGAEVNDEDLNNIVKGHMASVKAAKHHASNMLLIEDTDPVMTAVWSDMLVGQRHEWFDTFNDYADLYVLCDVDIPWVNDGTRYFPNQADRERFFNVCYEELIRRKVEFITVSGTVETRLKECIRAISLMFEKV